MKTDLGTYHVRVELEDGRGWIERYLTGARYTHGQDSSHPLTATRINPVWEHEEDLINTIVFHFIENNGSCDCNKRAALAAANQEDEYDDTCGETMPIKRLTIIRPDATELVIYLS